MVGLSLVPLAAEETSSVALAWNLVWEPDVAGYRVHYGTEQGTYTKVVDVGNKIETQLTGLVPGETYYSVVTAYSSVGLESNFSDEITFAAPAITGPDNPAPDTDLDGLSDTFEEVFGSGSDVTPEADLDGDGWSALAEFIHGTDPNLGTSVPVLETSIVSLNGERYFSMSIPLSADSVGLADLIPQRYKNSSSEPGWQDVSMVDISPAPTDSGLPVRTVVLRSTVPISDQPRALYRLRYRVTGAVAPDTDNDGLSDAFEVRYGDSGELSPSSDPDGDGWNSLAEFSHGTDPTRASEIPSFTPTTVLVDGERYFALSIPVGVESIGLINIIPERSTTGLTAPNWQNADLVEVPPESPAVFGPVRTLLLRSTIPITTQPNGYYRLRYELVSP